MSLRDSKVGARVVELCQSAQNALKHIPKQPGNTFVFASPCRRRAPRTDILLFWHKFVLPQDRITPLRFHDL